MEQDSDTVEPLVFKDRVFCFTGEFEEHSRKEIFALVERRGGTASKGITKHVHYLILGEKGNPNFKFKKFGAKYLQAMIFLKEGAGNMIAILPEEVFLEAVDNK